jgi:hypothetical protein
MGGLGGLGYGVVVILRARRQIGYQPVWEDWLWHTILPCGMYAALGLAALLLQTRTELALFVVGGAALVLLLIGIHNAWDTVTYLVTGSQEQVVKPGEAGAVQETLAAVD